MIPFVDLKTQYLTHQQEIESAMRDVCLSSGYIMGPALSKFEKEFAAFIGVKDAIGVASGTDALILALKAMELPAGGEILVPANTFIASSLAIVSAGLQPVAVDVDPVTRLMDLDDAKRRITTRTRAVMPVHLFGQSLDMDKVLALTAQYGLELIEDACQSHGASWNGTKTGAFGRTGCFSFYPAKNLGCLGDGGIITTSDEALGPKLRMYRNYGSPSKYVHEFIGYNSRLDAIQAAVLSVKLKQLDRWNAQRFAAAKMYNQLLADVPGIKVPQFDLDKPERHVFHLYVIECERRDALMDHLNAQQIQCGIHYPIPVHLHKAMACMNQPAGSCPVAEGLAQRILSLPIFPGITEEQINQVAQAVSKFHE